MHVSFPSNQFLIFLFLITHFSSVVQSIGLRWKWEVWEDIPSTSFMRVYLFNLTNPDEFESGGTPAFQEVGPYVFKETKKKEGIVEFDDDSRVRFHETKTYEFQRTESVGSEDDLVTIVNLPLLTFGKLLSEVLYVGPNFFKSLVKGGEKLTRRNERVGDVFYYGFEAKGYVKVLEALQGDQPIPEQFSGGRFGLFKGRNGTDDGSFLIGTGRDPRIPYGKILSWKNETMLNWWGGDRCNSINGTRGDAFDPKSLSKLHLSTFDPDLCRSTKYTYHGQSTFQGISSWKYVFSEDLLSDPRVDNANMCFCTKPGDNNQNCLKKGVIDLSACRNGAPLVLSYPHFFQADESYEGGIHGMTPNKSLHHSALFLEPQTGTVLKEVKRLQVNVHMEPLSSLTFLKNVPNLLLPIFWSEKIYSLSEEGLTLLKEELKNHPHEDVDEEGSWVGGDHGKISTAQDALSSATHISGMSSRFILILFSVFAILKESVRSACL